MATKQIRLTNSSMQSARISNRLPQVYRVLKVNSATPTCTRNMSLFPRIVANEFAPMFRLMDDYANHVMTSTSGREGGFAPLAQGLSKFQPKFDVKETSDSYELHGELPGVEQENISVEFTDAQTLTVRGQTETVREEGQRPTATIEDKPQQAAITEAETETKKSHQPSVEDEDAPATATDTEASSTVGTATPATEVAQPQDSTSTPRSRYWVREMSRGSFSRVFQFPSRVDQENVKASLKNGILSVVVPKAAAPQNKRINVE
ncbi:hypothetical protein LTR78_008361 [Recurvomyces mirabilis]|uniref:SHSP domain-containing protein n=2 Tax=Recurvomyces mirabilis TaxID=574656 RepID=A0AAE0TRP5_9PEZI|nr:hypothetical protein LTR78_008361 [Recurvomyces mirabilis]